MFLSNPFKLICLVIILPLCFVLSGCQSEKTAHRTKHDGPPLRTVDVSTIPDAIPKLEAKSRYGNPKTYKVFGKKYYVMNSSEGYKARGIASWYGTQFHGHYTSSREHYNMLAMTAAHKSLPLPTYVRVTNLENHRKIIVKVNDRGPFHNNRLIDLSYVAAKKLGVLARGTALVEVEAINLHKQPPHILSAKRAKKRFQKNTVPHLYLQLGAFSKGSNAERLRQQAAQYTKQPTIVKYSKNASEAGSYPLYRVQLGPFTSISEMDKVSEALHKAGFGNAVTVVS